VTRGLLTGALTALSLAFWLGSAAWGQANAGELRLKITDSEGLGVKSSVVLSSEANEYRERFVTDESGVLEVYHLPFGIYRVVAERTGFTPSPVSVEIRSAIPVEQEIKLAVAELHTAVLVKEQDTLIDPHRSAAINQIGSQMIDDRVSALPGRSLTELVDSQPGWLQEGTAVLHPLSTESR
jgi:hypothetical protein